MRRRQLPPLVALRAFDAVGRTLSVRAAGDELAVSHTVVSRHVHNLENWLGVKLVQARGRGLILTPEGVRYHAQIARAFDSIVRATTDLRPTARRTLTIWCFPGLATGGCSRACPSSKSGFPSGKSCFIRLSRVLTLFAERLMQRSSISTMWRAPALCALSCSRGHGFSRS